MKRLIIGDSRNSLLTTLETILNHWGYRVLASSQPERLALLLREISPNLVILAAEFLHNGDPGLQQAVATRVLDEGRPLILLGADAEKKTTLPHEVLDLPLDLFALFGLIQKHLEPIPRRNLRLDLKLPGLLSHGKISQFAEVLSLSTHGLFVKTSLRVPQGTRLQVTLPLFGMHQELEIECRVLYCIQPTLENNYLQGFGLEFSHPSDSSLRALQAFIEGRFLGEVAERRQAIEPESTSHLRRRDNQTVLRLMGDP